VERVWPDMLAALREVNTRWQGDMAPYFTELDGLPPDQGFKRVGEIFHVD
jgi:L-rhamnose mutarotase